MYKKLSEDDQREIYEMFLDNKSATVTGAVWDIEPAEVMAIAFWQGPRPPEDPTPAPARRPRILTMPPAFRRAV